MTPPALPTYAMMISAIHGWQFPFWYHKWAFYSMMTARNCFSRSWERGFGCSLAHGI